MFPHKIKMPTRSSYCYVLVGPSWNWHPPAPEEAWEIDIYHASGTEYLVGHQEIDGSPCAIFLCSDGEYRAILTAACLPTST